MRERGYSGVEEVVGWSKEEGLAHPFDLMSAYDDKGDGDGGNSH